MRWVSEGRERLRGLLFRGREEAEMDEEMRFHVEMEAERLAREEGLDPGEARRRAAVAFGGVERHKEEVREARGLAWVAAMSLDFRLGLRMLAKYPGITLVGGLGMAVAIAIGAGFFAFLHAHLYPRLPLEEGDRIIALENWDLRANNEERRSLHDFVRWREEMRSVRDVGAFRTVEHNLFAGDGPPELVEVAEMTAAGFRVARVPPLLGRHLVEDDERPGAPPVVVIGHDVWRARFEGDPAVVGREIRLGTAAHRVVGVMPEDFAFPMNHRFWTPLRADPSRYGPLEGPELFVFARLAPGQTLDGAQAELSAIGRRAAAASPRTHARLLPQALPYTRPLLDIQDPGGMSEVWVMQAMMSLLLVVVALNVAVLVYARTATRRGEIAVRTALGASRRRIVAQLFTEALLLASGAAVVGLALARFGLRQGNLIMEQEMGVPFWADYGLRGATVLYTVGLTVLAAVIVGVLPAVQSTGPRVQSDIRQLGGGTGMRLGRTWTALVVTQVAIAVAALPAAVTLGWKEVRNATTRPTYPAERFVVAGLQPMESEPPAEADAEAHRRAAAARFGERLTELARRVAAEPGVEGVTFTAHVPGRAGAVRIQVEGVPAPAESPSGHPVHSGGVGPGFFDVFGARVLTGRGLVPADAGEGATAVVVNRTFVRRVLGGGDALGRRIRYVEADTDEERGAAAPERWYEIVGVVDDLAANPLDPELVKPGVFYPVAPGQVGEASLAVRLRGSVPPAFGGRLREVAAELDPTLRLGTVRTMDELDRQQQLAVRLVAIALTLVVVSVLLLSAAGIYALMSFTVSQRRKEIGIRSALGAGPRRLLGSIFSRAVAQIAAGVLVGVAAGALVDRATGGGITGGFGPMVLPGVAALMAAVGLAAALGPARRGLRVPPMEALRE